MVVVYTGKDKNPLIQVEIVYSQTQSITNNTTTVSADVYYKILSGYGYGWNLYGVPFTLNIGGKKKTIDWKFDLRNQRVGSRHKITSHSATINHNSSGYAPRVVISVNANTSTVTFGNIRGSTSFTPNYIAPAPAKPDVPKYSKAAPFYHGERIIINWNKVARATNYGLVWESQNTNGWSYRGNVSNTHLDIKNDWTKVRTRLRAYDGKHPDVYSSWSAWQNVTPMPNAAPPPYITVPTLISGQKANIVWGASTSPNGSAVSYELQKKLTNGSWTTLVKGLRGASFADTITRDHLEIQYRVRATNSTGSSTWRTSPIRVVTVPVPRPPTLINIPNEIIGGNTIEIKWVNSADTDTYVLQRSYNGSTYETIYEGTKLTYSEKVPVTTNTISYRVQAINAGGGSGYTVTPIKTVLKPTPTTPTTIKVPTIITSGEDITISWGVSTVQDGTVTYGVVAYVNDNTTVVIATSSKLSSTIVNIPHSWDTVRFEVTPTSNLGQAGIPKTITKTIEHPAPTKPDGIKVPSLVSGKESNISWGASTDVLGRTLVYQLQVSNDGLDTSDAWEDVEKSTPNRSVRVETLPTQNTRRFRVRAHNGDKWGDWTYSNFNVVYHPKPPLAPTELKLLQVIRSGKDFTISWNEGVYAERYHLYRSIEGRNYQRVYSGSALKCVDNIPKKSTTVRYRIHSENVDGMSEHTFSELTIVQNFPEMKIKVGNEIKTTVAGWVKIDGALREIDTIYTKVAGTIKEAN